MCNLQCDKVWLTFMKNDPRFLLIAGISSMIILTHGLFINPSSWIPNHDHGLILGMASHEPWTNHGRLSMDGQFGHAASGLHCFLKDDLYKTPISGPTVTGCLSSNVYLQIAKLKKFQLKGQNQVCKLMRSS